MQARFRQSFNQGGLRMVVFVQDGGAPGGLTMVMFVQDGGAPALSKRRKGLAFLAWSASMCRYAQGPWHIVPNRQ